jgi:hypothetical protein
VFSRLVFLDSMCKTSTFAATLHIWGKNYPNPCEPWPLGLPYGAGSVEMVGATLSSPGRLLRPNGGKGLGKCLEELLGGCIFSEKRM